MKKKLIIIGIILVTIVLITGGFTFAKYTSKSIWNYYLESQGFYLSSDKLDSSPSKNVDNLWNGESVHFSLTNTLDNGVGTNFDINYKVTCTTSTGTDCFLNGTNSSVYEGVLSTYSVCQNNKDDGVDTTLLDKTNCEIKGYEWKNIPTVKDLYFDIADKSLNEVTVNITVSSTYPYRKTLSGEFKLTKDKNFNGNISMDYKNYTNYDNLIITNSYDEDKCVKVSWNADNLRIDSNKFISSLTDQNGYINEISLKIKGKENINYRFYKTNNKVYDISEFNLSEIVCSN